MISLQSGFVSFLELCHKTVEIILICPVLWQVSGSNNSIQIVMAGCSFLPVGIEKGQSVFPAVPWGGLFNFTVYCLISGNLLALKAPLFFYFFHCMISQCNAYNKCNYPTRHCICSGYS